MRTRPVWMVTVVLRDSASHPRSGLKILVYLRDIQHDALPVRPVRLHQLLDVLLVTEQRHGSQCLSLCKTSVLFKRISSQEIATMLSKFIIHHKFVRTATEISFLYFCKYASPETVWDSYCTKNTSGLTSVGGDWSPPETTL